MTMTVTHTPWVGPRYKEGVEGRSVLILGNSHWLGDGEQDTERVTQDVVESVVSGRYDIRFFNQIRDYFGAETHSAFWPRTAFMNFAPWSVGEGKNRYDHLTWEMAQKGKARFLQVVRELEPDLVFVFSRKILWALPEMGLEPRPLPLPGAATATIANLPLTRVILLRHPQGAPKDLMTRSVAAAMALECSEPRS